MRRNETLKIIPIFIPEKNLFMNIIITGASRGIGSEIVRILSRHKGNHIIALSRNGDALRKLAAECVKLNPDAKVRPLEFDLTQYDFFPFLLQKIESYFRNCDVLVNNAGRLVNKSLEKMEFQDFDNVFNVNVKSVYFLTQLLLPIMNKGSHIVNISSLGGFQGSKKFRGLTAYSSSKGALSILTEVLAEELMEREINVNCLALGAIQTEMLEKAFPGLKALQTPVQIAQFITDFAVTGHKLFNGKIIPVSNSVP
jgi:NAD(P)-dependent dehydrogenase (short-subunit alcohol dehydrogenase family)